MAKTVYVNSVWPARSRPGEPRRASGVSRAPSRIASRNNIATSPCPRSIIAAGRLPIPTALLGRVEGVDGNKTGFTLASGYNLASSVRAAKKHLVAVVLGGSSASSRDTKMEHLIEDNIEKAAAVRTAPVTTETVVVADDPRTPLDVMAPMAFSSAGIPGGFAATQPDLGGRVRWRRGPIARLQRPAGLARLRPARRTSWRRGDAALADEPTEVEQNSVPVEEAAAETSDRDLLQPMLAVLGGSLASVFGLQLVIFQVAPEAQARDRARSHSPNSSRSSPPTGSSAPARPNGFEPLTPYGQKLKRPQRWQLSKLPR